MSLRIRENNYRPRPRTQARTAAGAENIPHRRRSFLRLYAAQPKNQLPAATAVESPTAMKATAAVVAVKAT